MRDAAAAAALLGRLGACEVVERLDGDYDLIVDGVGGAIFGQAIEHLTPHGVVVNLATQQPEETVTFRAARFDRSPGARIYTLNLFDDQVELECSWREPAAALDALLQRRIGGKAVLHVD